MKIMKKLMALALASALALTLLTGCGGGGGGGGAISDGNGGTITISGTQNANTEFSKTSVYKGYKQDKIEMRGDRAEMSDFPLYLNMVAGGLDRRDQTISGFSFVVKIYAVPVVEIIG